MLISSLRRAFTLIELLVVIAIIAILAAILFPVFAQAKESGRSVVCISNMKQVTMAVMMYNEAYDNTFPGAAMDVSAGPNFAPIQMWIGYDSRNYGLYLGFYGRVEFKQINAPRPGAIDPYIKNEQVKRCPSMPLEWQLAICTNWFNPGFDSPYYTRNPKARYNEYGPMSKTFSTIGGAYLNNGATENEMDRPTETLLGWEHLARAPVCNFLQVRDWFKDPPNDTALRDHFHFLHRDAANAFWADGHVKRLTYGALERPYFSTRKDIYD